MIKKLAFLVPIMSVLLLTACGDDTQFRVEGTVEGLGTRNITLSYVSGGHLEQASMVAIDGKFSLTGSSKDYAIAELTVRGNRVIARMLVRNGESLKCKLDIDNPAENVISGSGPTERWLKFLHEKADTLAMPGEANSLIARYVGRNKDDVVSSALMLTAYDASNSQLVADSLINVIAPEARPESMVDGYRLLLSMVNSGAVSAVVKPFSLLSAGDSMERYYPIRHSCTLLAFTGDDNGGRDTVIRPLRGLREKLPRDRMHIVEVSSVGDSARWRGIAKRDSATWTQVWVPAANAYAPFDGLQIPYVPFYVVSDSTGRVLYRGASVAAAVRKASEHINRRNNAD